ncbi:tail tape measure protein TP901 core region [Ancylobacter novellus DSM 506]|uniref:Tail tape measure protein TP901 core region n=1 Tax=Ancylobacter novellus (strain ATCC 8093 / DSM 506 / JCM 20403 / CCM 1077 / IAM 12100 / NBRC 12443 / NCIMB 10456) TaxID=639283 RepID=D7A0A8_ANCN5|nr:tail tape measure protein TP901 core region [Ancylobacter novellus]ADH89369.1 tail tape measure protein TP901 core region [Ancylobacter novellus DSM 506]
MAIDDPQLVVMLEARIRDFERNFQRASRTAGTNFRQIERQASNSATRLQNTFAGIGRGMSTAFGAVAGAAGIGGLGAAGLFAGARTAAADLANLSAEAQRAGLGVEAFQELGYAAQQSRVNIDALTDGIKEMQLRADEFITTGAGGGAEALQRLGYSAEELKVKLADPAALFEEIIERLGQLDTAAQIRIADEIFGGTGGEQFVRLLQQGNGYIGRMRHEARDTGNVIDAELVQRAVEIDRAFARISATIGTNLKGALVGVVSLIRDFADMLHATENQSASTLQRRIELINAAVENARKSSLAFLAIGGDTGIASRLAERDELQSQLDSRPATSITVTKPGGMGDLSKITTPAQKAANDLAKAYDGIIASAQQRVASLNTETAALGMTTREAERFRLEQELIAEAQRAGITLTDAQRQAIAELASAYGDAAAAAEAASTRLQNAETMKAAFADIGAEGVRSFVADLRQGVSLTGALSNALARLGDRLMDLGLDLALSPLLNVLSGGLTSALGFSGGGAVPKFASGGHVRGPGTGTSDSIPAMLSNGEYVVNAAATARHRALLDAINAGVALPAFASGGIVRSPGAGGRGATVQSISFAPTISVSVEGGSRGPAADEAMGARIAEQIEGQIRHFVVDELMVQMRPGNILG